MRELEDELQEIKREIVESRGLTIKASNAVNALAADIKSISKRQLDYERRINWNSATAYVVFVIVVFTSLKFAVDARVDAIVAKNSQWEKEAVRLGQLEKQVAEREEDQRRASEASWKYYELIRNNRRTEIIRSYEATKNLPITKAEAALFGEAVERARGELAITLYLQGVEQTKLQRFAEAATSFEQSISHKDDSAVAPAAKLGLAQAWRKLRKFKEAVVLLDKLQNDPSDKEIQDDAIQLLANTQMDLEAWNDAKNSWKQLLHRFPDSVYAQEAKLMIQRLDLRH